MLSEAQHSAARAAVQARIIHPPDDTRISCLCGYGICGLYVGPAPRLLAGDYAEACAPTAFTGVYPKLESELLTAPLVVDFTRLLDRAPPQAERFAAMEAEIAGKNAILDKMAEDFGADMPTASVKPTKTLSAEVVALTDQLEEAKCLT
jgi:hypothetical protein